jgi:hypothetical protein
MLIRFNIGAVVTAGQVGEVVPKLCIKAALEFYHSMKFAKESHRFLLSPLQEPGFMVILIGRE